MANVVQIKPLSGNNRKALTILVDAKCIRCDREHTGGCTINDEDWAKSLRFRNLRSAVTPELLVHGVRYHRAEIAMGGDR